MSMKNKMMLAGASLAAALTLGTTVTTAHAATYDELNAKWTQEMEKGGNPGWLDLQSAAEQGDPEAQEWMKQVDGKSSTQDQQSQQTTDTSSQTTNSNSSNPAAPVTDNKAQSNNPVSQGQNNRQSVVANNAASTAKTTQSEAVEPSNTAVKSANNVQTLPQTGNDQVQAVAATGLGLATLAGMFGLGYLKQRA